MLRQILLIAILSFSTALTDYGQIQGGLSQSDISEQFKNSHFGKAMLRFVYLESKKEQSNYEGLFTALDYLENHLQLSKTNEKTQFEKEYTRYVTDTQFYENQHTQYQNEVAKHQIDLTELTDLESQLEKRLDIKLQELDQLKDLFNSENSALEEITNIYKTQLNELTQLITQLDEAISLSEEAMNGSFISEETLESSNIKLAQSQLL